MGFEVIPQVGVAGFRIDLGVRHPEWPYGYILGVECDGAPYHSSKSSRDRDRLRQEVLEGLGWRLHRIWSTDWFRNPRKEIEILREALADALARAKAEGKRHSERIEPPALITVLSEESEPPVSAAPPAVTAAAPPPVGDTARAPAGAWQSSQLSGPPGRPDLFAKAPALAAETANPPAFVRLGSKVKIESLSDGGKKLAFTLVEGENDPDNGKVGIHTPIGAALLDAQVGDEVEYQVGSHIKEVRVLEIR
jgi:very-short-patch-repair endonuclease